MNDIRTRIETPSTVILSASNTRIIINDLVLDCLSINISVIRLQVIMLWVLMDVHR